jgi:manganese-dependent inorganic pyrophosphatase
VTLLCDCLEATLLAGEAEAMVAEYHLFIGAMTGASFAARISGYERRRLLVITGDRPSIQQEAIESRVGVLIITGGFSVHPDLLARARRAGVTVLSTPHDTATAAWLARLSAPLTSYIETRFEQIGVNEPLEHLRLKLLHAQEPAVIAIEEDGTIAGIATKSSLLAPIPYALILVDHNELGQAVSGAESVEILEVIDHHKLGNAPTSQPITFMAVPVGSTCTIVATLYSERGIEPEGAIADLLLAAILSDTVILNSPNTTERDRELALWLAEVAQLDYLAFGRDIFSAGSGFSAYASKEEAVRADFKEFSAGEVRFGVGQVEVVGFAEFMEIKGELRAILQALKEKDRLDLAGLMVTDIYSETTLFLAEGKNEIAQLFGYPQLEPHLYELKGVMSRKKQMIPHLLKIFGALQ